MEGGLVKIKGLMDDEAKWKLTCAGLYILVSGDECYHFWGSFGVWLIWKGQSWKPFSSSSDPAS